MSVITLTTYEIIMGSQAGMLRQIENIGRQRKSAYGAGTENDWQLHIEGCLGELALAKYLNLFFSGKGEFRSADVGIVDVRTRSKDWYDLILHPNDPDDRKFYLVTGNNGTYTVRGWILGSEGKQEKYWKDPAGGRPAYFVPQRDLNFP
jgi:hypothetical protein